jgi:hypothetical protein
MNCLRESCTNEDYPAGPQYLQMTHQHEEQEEQAGAGADARGKGINGYFEI